MKNMSMKSLFSAAVMASMSVMAISALAEVVYQNDFATRTSTGVVPYGDWRELPYVTGDIVNTYATDPFNGSNIQDGWIRANNSSFCPITVLDDGGNNEVAFYKNDTTNKFAVIKQRIGNTFTNGVVALQCDFRTPRLWAQDGQATVTLGDKAFFSPDTSNAESLLHRVAQAGIIYDKTDWKLKYWHRHSSGTNVKVAGPTASTWYRLVITFNLDTRKWACDFYDLGASHPTLDTPTPSTAAFSRSDIDITSAKATEISSFAIDFYFPQGNIDSAEGLANAGFYDNIRISHNGEECYVNDFNARRSRVFGGTTAATYEANGLLVTNTVGIDAYALGVDLYPASTGVGSVAQPVGIDGWRRLNSAGPRTFYAYKQAYGDTADNPSVGIGNNLSFGLAAQPIGSTLRGGKVRLSADMRLAGTKNDDTIQQGMYVVLGSDDMYNGTDSTYGNGYCARVGLCAYKKTMNSLTYRRPHYFEDGTNTFPTGENEWVKQGTWLRLIVEVDFDTGTYSVEFRDQGTHPNANAADGTTVYYAKTGIKFYKPIEEITCFGLFAYYSQIYFDNIKIWHTASGASAARLVYENDFTSRTFYHDNVREGSLIGTLARNPVGQDGWTRADRYTSKVSVRNDGVNPALTFGNSSGSPAYAVHDIGTLCKSGKVTTQIDAKPPKYWIGGNRATLFWLGGDRFHEGNLGSNQEFYAHAATFFGFRDRFGKAANNVYTNVSLCAYNGNGAGGGGYVHSDVAVDPTHWYRFVAKTSITAGESDIAVYDMGTEHPTLVTATPATPVETFTGIKFRRAPETINGLSSLCVLGQGTADNTIDKTVGAFWDNIRIEHSPAGMMLIMR